ncbi:class I SAM-dependent methyltransferase [Halobaculum sp. MBLA0147]|uniref:class I SAM-dependent methyltransferase n=1 Tax=Halobaculum sp. MBLA0147 TaxID=3079934 RepID=UPI003523C351
MFTYYFGVYHLRRRLRRIGIGVGVAAVGAAVGTLLATDVGYAVGLVVVLGGLWYAQPAAKRLFVPAPWVPDRWKYAPLARGIDFEDADRWLDLGAGTGRSLVGLGDVVPEETTVTAVDSFDDRVIRGNSPDRLRANAATAGLDPHPVVGDAGRLPIAEDSQDVVTACRLLHDLSRPAAVSALAETRRVLREGGTLGVLALPSIHDEAAADEYDGPLDYWIETLEDADFRVTESGTVERHDQTYYYLVCE